VTDSLTARANTGAGTDQLAVDQVPGGAAGVVKVALGAAGAVDGYLSDASPMPIQGVFAEDSQHVSGHLGMQVLAVRRDADTAPGIDGDYVPLVTNAIGRLKVSVLPAATAVTTQAITAAAQTIVVDVSRESNVVVDILSGTFAGHNSTFEVSLDGVTYKACLMVRSNTTTTTAESTTGVLAAVPAYSWEASVNGFSFFRVRCTAHTSGTVNYGIGFGAFASEVLPAASVSGTQPVSGTVTATVTGGTVVGVAPTASIISSAATTNGTIVKASAGTLYSVTASNTGAAVAFLKLHNSTTVTVGTTPVALTIPIPAGGIVSLDLGPQGMRYGTGICLSITNLAADSDTTAVALAQVKTNIAFI
jgi:hypothetical protein